MTTQEQTVCFFCEKPQNEDAFCHGCRHFVCDDCSTRDLPFGAHEVDDHRDGEWDDDEEAK